MTPELFFIVQKTILIACIFGAMMGIAAYTTLAERKFAAFFQDRIGPNRAGPFGLLQPLADGLKFFFKEEFMPAKADRFLFLTGPCLAMLAACMVCAVIPFGPDLDLFGRTVPLHITAFDESLLYVFGMTSLGVYGIMIGGWASNNKYSLMSTIRASSQMISYELAMGMSLVALVMLTGSIDLTVIAKGQEGLWNVIKQPLGFIIFVICSFAEANRVPFDLAECETELIGGFHTEYSGMRLGFYLFSEYINMFMASAMMVTLYLGSYHLPFIDLIGLQGNVLAAVSVAVFFAKVFAIMFFFIWVRWTVPRFRYDQLMKLGWKVLIPAAFVNLFATALVVLL